jgi:Family of unknown function (DUF6331)
MDDEIVGDGWAIVPGLPPLKTWESFDEHVPKATWFWSSLEQHCVVECCGLDAYEFSHESVRQACGDDAESHGIEPRDPHALADSLVVLSALCSLTSFHSEGSFGKAVQRRPPARILCRLVR